MLKENSKIVYDYVKENEGKYITATDIAEATGLSSRQVNGIITSAFQKKGLMVREEVELELADGTHKAAKLIKLTEAGRNFVDSEDAE